VTLDCPAESPNVDDSNVRRSEAAGDAASVGCGSSLALGAVVGGASGVPVGAGMVADARGCCDPHAVISKTITAAVTRGLRSMAVSWPAAPAVELRRRVRFRADGDVGDPAAKPDTPRDVVLALVAGCHEPADTASDNHLEPTRGFGVGR
jgi:hypothetical protein